MVVAGGFGVLGLLVAGVLELLVAGVLAGVWIFLAAPHALGGFLFTGDLSDGGEALLAIVRVLTPPVLFTVSALPAADHGNAPGTEPPSARDGLVLVSRTTVTGGGAEPRVHSHSRDSAARGTMPGEKLKIKARSYGVARCWWELLGGSVDE